MSPSSPALPLPVPGKAPTRNDVAARAQVSTAVVSYVMTGSKRVTPDKERRVREAMAELGYRPNNTARALRTGKTFVLALLLPDSSNPYFAEIALRIESVAAEQGYGLLIANTHDDPATELRLLREMRSRGADGVILASVFHATWPGDAREIPLVLIDAFHPVDGVPSVGVDAAASTREAVQHLVEVHGCRSVALILGASSDPAGNRDPRQDGWEQALDATGARSGGVAVTSWSREGGITAAHELLAGPDRPDAIFAASDLLGIGVLRAAADLGLRVPQDLAVVSYDGSTESAFSIPRLTTVAQPIGDVARAAVAAVLAPPAGDGHYVSFPGQLLIRESCGCAQPPHRVAS
ncbi:MULTISPECIES: LacI family DNA-binding transcriptional regulator [Microbacterium]|uniref:LacI family DNA-binding transcriptional regulator n=1 Tax=Microbacterium TaxID=33882 RepID=UPI0027890571|nr:MULTISPECIES: LacI family DNA-binding transcriptional regulator [Microbacterium]MDQ1085214.1 LacI family transcriptional regulator [Microbacterium sp. SORGH_AS_0344]MDQ1169480.1 LacI family transcriptional regulator [Microbacterium proteolyticum]